MNAVEEALFFLTRPRVIHALPGRLRLHLPSLKRWGREYDGLVSLTASLLASLEGIHDVSPCVTTGNVLIRYDAERLSEDELVTFLGSWLQICRIHRAEFLRTRTEDLVVVEERLRRWLHKSVSQRLYLDHRLKVPEDVFQ